MPFTTPPTFADAAILSAAQLNILSDDISWLFGLVGGPNLPFNSLASGIVNLSSSNNSWLLRHRHRYLHYLVRLTANDNNDLDLFYNGVRVYHDETDRAAQYTYTGYVDLHDPETWSDWIGAWALTTGYSVNDVVSNGGTYFACIQAHTSSAGDEPGVGGSWTSYWVTLNAAGDFATVGTFYRLYVDTNLQNSGEVTVDYLIEADGTTL
jgi:hypothetical protein